MVFDTNIAIALKNYNGQYKVEELTIFELESMKTKFASLSSVEVQKGNDLVMKLKCPLCGENHFYHYNTNELLKRNMVIGGCEQLGLPIFLIGKNEKVIEKVKEHRQSIEKVYAMI